MFSEGRAPATAIFMPLPERVPPLLPTPTTPGCSSASCVQSRPFSGSSRMVVPLTLCRSVADTVSTEAAATDTWTFSLTLPTDIAKSIGSSAPTVSVMPLFVWVLNPSKVAVTSYGPGSRLGAL